jgi:hypothetical protein
LHLDDSGAYSYSAGILQVLEPLLLETLTTRYVTQEDVMGVLQLSQQLDHVPHLKTFSITTDDCHPAECGSLVHFSPSLRSLCVRGAAITNFTAGAPFSGLHLHTLDLHDARQCTQQGDRVDEMYAHDLFMPHTYIVVSLRVLVLTLRNVNAKAYISTLIHLAHLESFTLSSPSLSDSAMTISCQRLLFTILGRMPTLRTLDVDFKFSCKDDVETDPVTETSKKYDNQTPLHFLGLPSLTKLDVFSTNMRLAPLPLSLRTFQGQTTAFLLRKMSPPPNLATFLNSTLPLDSSLFPLFEH